MRRALLLTLAALALATPATAQAAEPGIVLGGGGAAGTDRNISAVVDAKAKWARVFMYWAGIEPVGPGNIDRSFDAFVAMADRFKKEGIKFNLVITGSPEWASGVPGIQAPPRDPAEFARFVAFVADRLKGKVALYEIWNEADGPKFWPPAPDVARYTQLLKLAYPAIKSADPAAKVSVGGLVGNDYPFLEGIYANGGKGSFDGVAAHTDTGCQLDSPYSYYRIDGRIGPITFLGYRELRKTMLANGDPKPIWLTEIGWSTATVKCDEGPAKDKKPGGVSLENQALYLKQAFHCLAEDDYVEAALWFNLHDEGADTPQLRYGLYDNGFAAKPALAAFKTVAESGDTLTGPCGDFAAPAVTVSAPTDGAQFSAELPVEAMATDTAGVNRISMKVDGQLIRNFTDPDSPGTLSGGITWQGAKKLSLGEHTLTFDAVDPSGNEGTRTVKITKVDPSKLAAIPTTTILTLKNAGPTARKISARVLPGQKVPRVPGKLKIIFEKKVKGRFKAAKKYTKPAKKPVSFTVSGLKKGQWRVRATYFPEKPFGASKSKVLSFRTR